MPVARLSAAWGIGGSIKGHKNSRVHGVILCAWGYLMWQVHKRGFVLKTNSEEAFCDIIISMQKRRDVEASAA
jgi:hypothetical protein